MMADATKSPDRSSLGWQIGCPVALGLFLGAWKVVQVGARGEPITIWLLVSPLAVSILFVIGLHAPLTVFWVLDPDSDKTDQPRSRLTTFLLLLLVTPLAVLCLVGAAFVTPQYAIGFVLVIFLAVALPVTIAVLIQRFRKPSFRLPPTLVSSWSRGSVDTNPAPRVVDASFETPVESETKAAVDPASYLIALGQISIERDGQKLERVGLLARRRDGVEVVFDEWMSKESIAELRHRMPKAMFGKWDVMFATKWKYAWSIAPTCELWDVRGRRARVVSPGTIAARSWFGRESIRAIKALYPAIRGYGFRQEVRAVPIRGREIVIARRLNPFFLLDDDDDWWYYWIRDVVYPFTDKLQIDFRDPRGRDNDPRIVPVRESQRIRRPPWGV